MPLVKFQDAAGKPIQFMEVDGVLYPYIEGAAQDHSIPAARSLKGRDDDVLLINYAKSGTHWIWEVLCMLYQRKAETIPGIKQYNMIEALTPEQLEAMPSPRILNTHFPFDHLPLDMIKRKTKIILIHRNPKDIAVSHYHHHLYLVKVYNYEGEWKNWLPLFIEGKADYNSWFDYVRQWERVMNENPDYPIHLMYFEDMKEDGLREVEKLAKFLNLPVTEELCRAVADKCTFENMVVDKKGLENEFWTKVWRDDKPRFYRKGIVGDWKNWFTVAQNEAFDKLYQEKMKDSKLRIRFEI